MTTTELVNSTLCLECGANETDTIICEACEVKLTVARAASERREFARKVSQFLTIQFDYEKEGEVAAAPAKCECGEPTLINYHLCETCELDRIDYEYGFSYDIHAGQNGKAA